MKKLLFISMLAIVVACNKDPEILPVQEIQSVLILGNSITHHYPAPEVGWHGSWGMAASANGKDYVSILSDSLKTIHPNVQVNTKIMVDFERGFWEYDYEKMADLQNLQPDLLIWRLAENILASDVQQHDLVGPAEHVIKLIKANNPSMRVIFTTSFWGPTEVNQQLKNIASKNKWEIVDLYPLAFDNKYRAIGKFENEGVAIHPGDKGMLEIANLIWAQVKRRTKP